MAIPAHSPEAIIDRFADLLAEGDLDALVDLYEPDAAFAAQPGAVVVGRSAIRQALEPFVALRPRMVGAIEKVVTAADTALVINRWRLTGSQPDGTAVEMAGTSSDVLRRRPDGSWAIVIDDPWGALPADGPDATRHP
jgi:uncharacterized protein (TIGR02246 family)